VAAEGTDVGQVAPDFTLVNQDDEEVSLSDFRGKQNVVLVFYVGAFTSICDGEFHGITANAERYDASNAVVLGVSTDTKWTLKQYKDDRGFPATFLSDFWPHGNVSRQYGVFVEAMGFAKRGTFIIDKNGVIQGKVVNEPLDARDEADNFAALQQCSQ
jgi:peroxiredoxin